MAVVVDALRTPIGKLGGTLASVRPDDLLGHVVRAMAERHALESVDDVIAGCANQSGEDGRNVARMAVILAGLPLTVPAQTVNRLCGSSMQAIIAAAHALDGGCGDVILAGGVESMSRGAYAFAKAEKPFAFGNLKVYDTTLGWRFHNPKIHERVRPLSMGETAEEIFQTIPVSREEQDAFAFDSHQKALAAWKTGKFANEVVPVILPDKKGDRRIDRDEGPREDTTLEKLASLKPAFRSNGTVTAGNSCPLNDGASMTLMMTESEAERRGFKTGFRLKASGVTALHPDVMGLGPVEATRLALRRAGLSIDDLGLVELNEAFAIQALACMRELGLHADRVNVNGGAIAIGHPLGCSGARLVGTLVHEMRRRNVRYGLATMCIGVGQGIATIWEKVDL
jgi:acetyl-CoA acetyltransferase family protein